MLVPMLQVQGPDGVVDVTAGPGKVLNVDHSLRVRCFRTEDLQVDHLAALRGSVARLAVGDLAAGAIVSNTRITSVDLVTGRLTGDVVGNIAGRSARMGLVSADVVEADVFRARGGGGPTYDFGGDVTAAGAVRAADLVLGPGARFGASVSRLFASPTGSDASDGAAPTRPVRSLRRACQLAEGGGKTVVLEPGAYEEPGPVFLPPGTRLDARGATLTCPAADALHLSDGCEVDGLRSDAGASFPRVIAEAAVEGGEVAGVRVLWSAPGYDPAAPPAVRVAPPPAGGTTARATAVIFEGRVVAVTVDDGGGGYVAPPHVSIRGPASRQPAGEAPPRLVGCALSRVLADGDVCLSPGGMRCLEVSAAFLAVHRGALDLVGCACAGAAAEGGGALVLAACSASAAVTAAGVWPRALAGATVVAQTGARLRLAAVTDAEQRPVAPRAGWALQAGEGWFSVLDVAGDEVTLDRAPPPGLARVLLYRPSSLSARELATAAPVTREAPATAVFTAFDPARGAWAAGSLLRVDQTAGTVALRAGPSASPPAAAGSLVFEMTSDRVLTVRARGGDGVVRSAQLPLA